MNRSLMDYCPRIKVLKVAIGLDFISEWPKLISTYADTLEVLVVGKVRGATSSGWPIYFKLPHLKVLNVDVIANRTLEGLYRLFRVLGPNLDELLLRLDQVARDKWGDAFRILRTWCRKVKAVKIVGNCENSYARFLISCGSQLHQANLNSLKLYLPFALK